MPGDVVRRLIAGKDTQRGYCRDIVMTAALQIVGTKHVIPSVASERLQPLEEFTPDLAVCLDSWVGTSKVMTHNGYYGGSILVCSKHSDYSLYEHCHQIIQPRKGTRRFASALFV